jgi:hypothetical protein
MSSISKNLRVYGETSEVVDELLEGSYLRLINLSECQSYLNYARHCIDGFKSLIGEGESKKYAPLVGIWEDKFETAMSDFNKRSGRQVA